jgi:hypothetical protein
MDSKNMNERARYLHYFLKNTPSALKVKLFHKQKGTSSFCGQKGITIESSSKVIADFITAGKPFCAVRYGGSEISCLNGYEKIRLGFAKTYKDSARWAMKVRAGFYPTDDQHLNEYCELVKSHVGSTDILAILGLHMEDYLYEIWTPKAKVITNWALEPLLGRWTPLLKGKKVLVVSPFSDEILFQYSRREKLFPKEPDRLPEFELKVLQAPMTLGESTDYRFPSFMRSLEEIEERIKETDFDIALVGAGAYGILLTLYCKSLGKMALQTGGATQTLFGIMGKRWENRPHVASRVNEYWIRPDPTKKPKGYEKIDNGAYW